MVTALALASHQCGPGSNPGFRHHMWVEFFVGSPPSVRQVFLRVLRFSPLLKNQHFQIPIRSVTHRQVSTCSEELQSASWVNKLQSYRIIEW